MIYADVHYQMYEEGVHVHTCARIKAEVNINVEM